MNIVKILCWVSFCLTMAGCAQRVYFQTVDAETRMPVGNVSVATRHVSAFDYFKRERRMELIGFTDDRGEIAVRLRQRTLVSFSNDGYFPTFAGMQSGVIQVSDSRLNVFTNYVAEGKRGLVTVVVALERDPKQPK